MVEPLSTHFRPLRGSLMPAFEGLAAPPSEHLVAAEIEARTVPGDVVIELHGRGAWVTRSALDRLRRVYDIESIGLTRLQAELVLRPPDVRHLDAAVNSLAVHLRAGVGLRSAILASFTSRCAACGRPVIVEEFIWPGEGDAPSHKTYRCEVCGGRGRSSVGLTVPVDDEDVRAAREMGRAPPASREFLRARFPTPESGHPLPGQLVDLYSPRSLEAFALLVERLETDLRAPPIEAALRLAVAHMLLPGSRLNRHPGRAAGLRIAGGRLRLATDRGWRERNPWLLFEDGVRVVRGFIQRMEGVPGGNIQARLGNDLAALVDGAANVVMQQGDPAVAGIGPSLPIDRAGLPGRLDARSRVRLVLTQPPIHWAPENLAYAYLATSIALGRRHAEALPLDGIFGSPSADWSRDVATLGRSLRAVRPSLAADARAVIIVDRTGPAGLSAAVLGGVAADMRLTGALLTEDGDTVGGSLEFSLPEQAEAYLGLDPAAPPGAASLPVIESASLLAEVESAVTKVAVATLQARGEPARFEHLLGEVLIGLDESGLLKQLANVRLVAGAGPSPERALMAVGLFGELLTASPRDPLSRPRASAGVEVALAPAGAQDASAPAGVHDAPAPAVRTMTEEGGSRVAVAVASGSGVTVAADAEAEHRPPGGDPTKRLLEMVLGELRRPGHDRLTELEPGRWWLRDERDIGAARPPLSDRLEWFVFSILSTSGGLSEEAFRDRLAGMMRGHDTPDAEMVRACLTSYRSSDPPPDELRTDDTLQARYEEHGLLVGMLAEYGERLGLRRWISQREQKRSFKGRPLSALLSEAEARVYLPLVTPGEADALEAVDCFWYVRGKAAFLFEVEWTAMLSEPVLRRGRRIPSTPDLIRFIVIPPERTELVRLKLERSPILRTAMEEGNWHILKSDHLRRLHARETADLADLQPLLGLDPEIEHQGKQLALFG